MKKRIGILLAAAMAASLTVTSFAANLGEYMPDDVIQWLQEGEANAETVDEQAVNGTARLVEMLSLIANVNATEDQAQLLTEKMDKLNQALESENLSAAQVHGVVASLLPTPLYVLSQQADSQGLNAEKLDGLLAEFEQADEATELDEEQTANALKYAVLFTAAVTEEICPDEEGQQRIEEHALDRIRDDQTERAAQADERDGHDKEQNDENIKCRDAQPEHGYVRGQIEHLDEETRRHGGHDHVRKHLGD